MSTLKLQANPFLVHGRSQSDNNYLNSSKSNKTYHLDMPRTYSPPLNVSTPYIDRKRKFDEDLLVTPEHSSNHGALITPPRSYKRSKTVPSSPVNSHDIYETPKTPSFKQDVLINLGSSSSIPRSPEYRSSPAYRIAENVTPPQSTSGSPKQTSAMITSPTVLPSRKSQGNEYAYLYADTCYPFNIAGSAVGRSEGNLRLKTWREACNEKVRHEYNKALKDYNAFSATLSQAAKNTMNETPSNPPALFDEKIFPSAAHMSKVAYSQLNYPFASQVDNSQETIEYEAQLLLGLRSQGNNNVKTKADYPLKHSSNNVTLPPISEILKYTPFDKSTVHPSGLSTLEINHYQNSKFPGIVFNKTSKQFYNGREIRKNMPLPVNDDLNFSNVQYGHPTVGNTPYATQQSYTQNSHAMAYRGPYKAHASYCPSTIPSIVGGGSDAYGGVQLPQLQSPIKLKPLRSQGANAYDDLSNELKNLSDNEKSRTASLGKTIKQFQTQFKTQPLKVTKTRRNSVSKVKKDSTSSSIAQARRRRRSSSSVSTPSRPSSRSSSRKSSASGASVKSVNKSQGTVSNTTTGYRPRTRSSSRSRCSSSESIKTAEVPASVETTPKTSPSVQKSQSYVAKTNSLLFPSYDSSIGKKTLDFSKSTILSVVPVKAQMPVSKTHNDNASHNHTHNHTHTHTHQPATQQQQQQQSRTKKCMSCFSSLSPCWRPSWAPDEGQLCNSCGLRYRKTKARCYNPACLKIPSKSEWALMVKRGEVLLDVYDPQGHVVGKKMSYRCLDCDSAMEVSR